MAWPPIVADNVDVVSATHINSIVASVQTWQGPVNAGNHSLTNVAALGIGTSSAPAAPLDVNGNVRITGLITQDSWVSPTLQNGWGGQPGYAPFQVRKDKQGRVWVRGTIAGGTFATGTSITILAVEYRPTSAHSIAIAGVAANCDIAPDGSMKVYGLTTNSYVHLYGSWTTD